MNSQLFKEKALEISLRSLDKAPEEWITFNDQVHTKILDNELDNESTIPLEEEELAIVECKLEDSYVLITTRRVVSKISGSISEIFLNEITGFSNKYEKENHDVINGQRAKINRIEVIDKYRKGIVIIVDSYYPTHFVKVLIQNLSSFLKRGKWFLDL